MPKMTRKVIALKLIAASMLGADAATQNRAIISYEQRLFVGASAHVIKTTIKSNALRQESWSFDSSAPSGRYGFAEVTIQNNTGTYQFFEGQQQGSLIPNSNTKIKNREQHLQDIEFANHPEKYLAQLKQQNHAVLIGTETINGFSCNVYKFLNAGWKEAKKSGARMSDAKGRVWLWVERPYPPIKVEMSMPIFGFYRIEVTHLQLAPQVDEAMFQPPPDMKIKIIN